MSTYNPEDKEIQDLLRETPMGQTTPEDLKRRLRVMASGSKIRKHSRWAPRFAFMSACLVIVAAFALMLWPASASAKTFQKVIDATNLVKTFRLAIHVLEGGKEQNVTVQSGEGIIDVQAPNDMHIQLANNEIRVYEAEKNELKIIKLGNLVDNQMISQMVQEQINQGLSQIDVKKMLAEFKDQFGAQNAKVSDIYNEDGQMVYTVDLSSPKASESVKLTVDADSDLPLRIQVRENGRETADIRLEFGRAIDIVPLEKSVPANVKTEVVDVAKMMQGGFEEMGKNLNKNMPGDMQFDSKEFKKGMKELQKQFKNGKAFGGFGGFKSVARDIKNDFQNEMKKR